MTGMYKYSTSYSSAQYNYNLTGSGTLLKPHTVPVSNTNVCGKKTVKYTPPKKDALRESNVRPHTLKSANYLLTTRYLHTWCLAKRDGEEKKRKHSGN